MLKSDKFYVITFLHIWTVYWKHGSSCERLLKLTELIYIYEQNFIGCFIFAHSVRFKMKTLHMQTLNIEDSAISSNVTIAVYFFWQYA